MTITLTMTTVIITITMTTVMITIITMTTMTITISMTTMTITITIMAPMKITMLIITAMTGCYYMLLFVFVSCFVPVFSNYGRCFCLFACV